MERITDAVYAGLVNRNPPMYVFANALIVLGADQVLVVDTHASPSAARAMIRNVRALTSLPVRTIVNTHWHGDHVYGNSAYADSFPDVRIIAHASAADMMRGPGAARLHEEMIELEASISERARWLASGTGPAGESLDAAARARVERSLRLARAQLEELRALELQPPTEVVEDSLTLDIGGREVRLYYAGPAHTPGDLLVWLPAERILAVGDLLEEGLPYAGESYPAGWLRALNRIVELDPAIIVPSHGGVQRDRTLLDAQRTLFRDVVAAGRSRFCAGLSGEATVEQGVAELLGQRPPPGVSAEAYEDFLRDAIGRAFTEAEALGTRAVCLDA
jgi:cyclase